MVLTLGFKIGIIAVVIIVIYFVLKYFFEYDLLVEMWESISGIEFNITALIVTLVMAIFMYAVIWLNPFWVKSTFFTFEKKLFLTVAFPIIGYVLAVRGLNKE